MKLHYTGRAASRPARWKQPLWWKTKMASHLSRSWEAWRTASPQRDECLYFSGRQSVAAMPERERPRRDSLPFRSPLGQAWRSMCCLRSSTVLPSITGKLNRSPTPRCHGVQSAIFFLWPTAGWRDCKSWETAGRTGIWLVSSKSPHCRTGIWLISSKSPHCRLPGHSYSNLLITGGLDPHALLGPEEQSDNGLFAP